MHERYPASSSPPKAGRRQSAAFWAALVFSAGAVWWASWRVSSLSWGAVGLMAILGVATGWFSFPVGNRRSVSFSVAVFVATVALFGLPVGVLTCGLTAAVLEAVRLRRGFRRAVVQVGLQLAAVCAGGAAYSMVGGVRLVSGVSAVDALRLSLLFSVLVAVPAGFVALRKVRTAHTDAKRTATFVGRGVGVELITLPLALLLVMSYTTREVPAFPLLAIVLVVASAAGRTLWDTRQSLVKRIDELGALNAVGQTIASARSIDEIATIVHREVSPVVSTTFLSLCRHSASDDRYDFRIRSSSGAELTAPKARLNEVLARWVVRHGEPLAIGGRRSRRDTSEEPFGTTMESSSAVAGSWVGVPLVVGEELTGVLSFGRNGHDAFSRGQVDFLRALGSQVARAVENVELCDGLRRSRAEAEEWSRLLEQRVEERTAELSLAREELQSLNEDLEKRVRERTEQLDAAREKVIQSGRLAAVGELAAGVAHELNNPIAGILGYAQLDLERLAEQGAADLSDDDLRKVAEHLTYIERESQRCKTIVENLLHFSQSSINSRSAVNLSRVLKDTLAMTGRQLSVRGIEVDAQIDDQLPLILGDKRQLQQVFANIILNAQRAMSGGGKLNICARTQHDAEGGPHVLVEFRDTGTGICRENLPKIFDPFFTTREVGEGNGLGLSVSYGIIREHGGEIDVESAVGSGSTFIVRLPRCDSAAAPESSH